VERISTGAEWLLDTSFALALASRSDDAHARALELNERIRDENVRLVTTRAVLVEIGNALSRVRHRPAALSLLRAIEGDPRIQVVPFADELYHSALELYASRPDKEWGLTDCASFVVMQRHGVTEALTADHHFEQAGFRALLR